MVDNMEQSVSKYHIPRKYCCSDCQVCQGCSESRCRVCLSSKKINAKKKISIFDQLAIYNSLNPGITGSPGCDCKCQPVDDGSSSDDY